MRQKKFSCTKRHAQKFLPFLPFFGKNHYKKNSEESQGCWFLAAGSIFEEIPMQAFFLKVTMKSVFFSSN